jgi:uncharacterized integral membrane protein
VRSLRLILVILIGCVLAWFAINNWVWVEIVVLPGRALAVKLPALVFASLLIGALPGAILHRVSAWRLKREIAHLRRAAGSPPPPASPALDTASRPGAPVLAPTAVPGAALAGPGIGRGMPPASDT